MNFQETDIKNLQINPWKMIGDEWMLVTAEQGDRINTMTASWGGVGIMWGKPSVTAYIRQSRYTKEFVDREELFTISIFDEAFRPALNLCGTVSGRDRDKIREAGLTPFDAGGAAAFEEAKLIFVCRKQYHTFLSPDGFDVKENDSRWYADRDYHTMYIGAIEKVLMKE